MQQWNNRFHEHETFWVDVQPDQTASGIAKMVTQMITAQGIMTLAGQTVVMAVFLDLTQSPKEKLISEILKVPTLLNNVLGCTVPLTMEFGYLDEMAFADKVMLRGNAKQIVHINAEYPQKRIQLCLLAKSPLVQEEDDNSWKAAIVLLDVLRRMSAPASFVPVGGGGNPNDDIGFIRFGDYNAKKVERLNTEKEKLAVALGNGGQNELKVAVDSALSAIESDIEENYLINSSCQPIHPHMIVDGFLAKKSAARGRNSQFNMARNATWSALEQTGKNLCSLITEAYQSRIANTDAELAKFIEKAGVGIELEEDSALMSGILQPEKVRIPEPMAPGLAYSETGYTTEIEKYLKDMRHYAAGKVKQAYAQALYDSYRAIDVAQFAEKRAQLNKHLANVNIHLTGLLSRNKFFDMVATEAQLPQATFFPVLGGGSSASFVLCRKQQDHADLNQVCPHKTFYIDEKFGGLKTLDESPMMALQLLLFDCDDQRLEDLIK